MGLKILRCFFGGYIPNYQKLTERGYKIIPSIGKRIVTVLNSDQGFGQIKGTTKKLGVDYSPVPICVFKRSNRQLLWETKSKSDGSYSFRNIAIGLECFIVAFDPSNQYNAVIQDRVIAK